jgi:hypothetical protein
MFPERAERRKTVKIVLDYAIVVRCKTELADAPGPMKKARSFATGLFH